MRHGTCDGGHVSAASSSPDSVEQKELAQSAAIIGQAWDSTATGADQDDETRSLNSSLLLILFPSNTLIAPPFLSALFTVVC